MRSSPWDDFIFISKRVTQIVLDDEGTDLPDLSAAQREAILVARELLTEAIKSGKQEVPGGFRDRR